MNHTIPLSARAPRAFTPPTLAKKHDAACETWASSKAKSRGKKPALPRFFIAVPTLTEKDTIGQLMFELGLVPITRDQTRMATLKALLNDDRDDDAAALEGFWQKKELHEAQLEIWDEQERQRRLDQLADPDTERQPFEQPEDPTTMRERIHAQEVVDEMVAKTPALRKLLAAQTTYTKRYQTMTMRVHLRGWEGLETQRVADTGPDMPELVTEECLEELREEIGRDAWLELHRNIDAMYALSPEEVGNFASPSESGSNPDGSSKEGELETASGDSTGPETETKSSSAPIPEPASDQTTEPS